MRNRRAEDQDIRDLARDVRRSFIVRAPAGSGKTHLLIQRYLALLARVEEPEEIVAITFTRKAAAEMRERVLSAFAEANRAAGTLDEQTRELARAALARDTERGWQLTRNASRLRIQTIDALNSSITRQMPLAARFGAQPENVEDAGAMYREAARAVLAEVNANTDVAADVAVLLTHLDNNLFVAENLLAEMLRARDQWLRNFSGMSAREVLEAALSRARTRAIAEVFQRFPAEEMEETLALARFAGQNTMERRTDAGVWPLDGLEVWPDASETGLPAWLAIADLLLTQNGTWRKRRGLNKKNGFPPGEGKVGKARCVAAKARMGDLLERLEGSAHSTRLAVALDHLWCLPPARYTELQWEVVGAIVRLLRQATAVLWTVFGAHGQCDFTEIAQAASRALGEDGAPSDLALALDYRIQHLLVDEFQDTSRAQFELLAKLTRGWSADDGRTLFLVGDPMQSIYRFRKAEVELFDQATDDGIGTVALVPRQLTVNFRSRRGIVEWVNQTFALLMPEKADAAEGQVAYAACEAFADADELRQPAVTWHPQLVRNSDADADDADEDKTADTDQVEEARCIVGIVKETLKEFAAARSEKPNAKDARKIALLVRNRSHLAAIVPALKAANISFRAVDIDPLKERPVVQDLLTLTRALLHPADRIAWLALLRAPWCGLTLHDLAVLAGGAQAVDGALTPDARTPWELISDESRLSMLSTDGRARLGLMSAVIAPAINMRRRQPLRELVESVWLALRGPACLPNRNDLDDARQLLDLLEAEAETQTGGSHIIDLEQLDARVEKLFAGNRPAEGSEQSAVQIMTIHKAKGLEFDTVIVPALHRIPRRDDKKLLAWAEQPIPGTRAHELLLAPIRESGAAEETDAIYRYVQQRDRDKQHYEDVRLLYVAATRAKRRLHLLGGATVKNDNGEEILAAPRVGSLLASLWPAVESVFREAMARPIAKRPPATTSRNADSHAANGAMRLVSSQALPRMPAAISPALVNTLATPSAVIDFEWAGETARHVGTVVHAFLQRMAEDGLARWNRQRILQLKGAFETELARLGVVIEELPAAMARVSEALAKTLDHARGRWVLEAHRQQNRNGG